MDPEAPDADALRGVAEECVDLVSRGHGRDLDWSPDSLDVLDAVCAELIADGPLTGERLRLWRMLVGAYTGEVVIRRYDGEWVTRDDQAAILVLGVTGFPFGLAHRILTGEPFKSLASFARSVPIISENAENHDH